MAKTKGQKSLSRWTDQDWDYVTERDKKKPKSKRGRYLPHRKKLLLIEKNEKQVV